MPVIIMTRNAQVNGEVHQIGDVVHVDESEARLVINAAKARLASDEDIRNCRNPQPAADVRRTQVKKPGRIG